VEWPGPALGGCTDLALPAGDVCACIRRYLGAELHPVHACEGKSALLAAHAICTGA